MHPPLHPPTRHRGHGAVTFLRRNVAFIVSLILAAAVVWLGSRYLRHRLYGTGNGDWDGNVMELRTCLARLSALGVLPDETGQISGGIHPNAYALQRHDVYTHMAEDVAKKGLKLGGVITQGLTQEDLFHITVQPRRRQLPGAPRGSSGGGVSILPVLKPLDIPVRAMILPLLDTTVAHTIGHAVREALLAAVPEGGIWLQDMDLFHATVFHASSHVKPVVAETSEILDEHRRIQDVARRICPIQAVLERVVVTSGGVIVACWQATQEGGEPASLRQALAEALPNAPPKEAQMVKEPTMLHTTLARLLQAPAAGAARDKRVIAITDTRAVVQAVQRLSNALCGLEASFGEMWFVEEQDLLALALQGRFVKHTATLVCPPQPPQQEAAAEE